MSLIKITKDKIIKLILGDKIVPEGLFELYKYFLNNGVIEFKESRAENGDFIAVSTNFRQGSIIATGKNRNELDENMEDAILTSFDIPSSYRKEAALYKKGSEKLIYAIAK